MIIYMDTKKKSKYTVLESKYASMKHQHSLA